MSIDPTTEASRQDYLAKHNKYHYLWARVQEAEQRRRDLAVQLDREEVYIAHLHAQMNELRAFKDLP